MSCKILLPPIRLTNISPNQITVGNFFLNNLPAIWCFATKHYYLALYFCLVSVMLDYVDGELAREKGGETKLGTWLDISLDWLWYLMLLGGIAYGINSLVAGMVCIISTVFANYIDTNKPTKKLGNFPFSPITFIVAGVLFNQMKIAFYCVAFFAILRMVILWILSIKAFNSD